MEVKEFEEKLSASQKEIISAVKQHSDETHQALEKADKELKEFGKVAEATKNEVADLNKKSGELQARMEAVEQLAVRTQEAGDKRVKTVGELLIENGGDDLKAFAASQRGVGKSFAKELELKDVTSAAGSAGAGIWSFRDPEIVSDPYRPRMLRTLIPTIPVDSNLIEYVRTNVRTNAADTVSETGLKPKSDITYQRKEVPVRKIAHYFKTSSEVLSDFARLQGELNFEGMEMLKQVEEDQLLSGDGTGVNLLGLVPQATPFNTSVVTSNDQAVDILRRAALQVRQSFYSATGIVLNPADWAAIELLKDGENRYLFSAATSGAPKQLWGLPVVESDALTQGEFMVGAFATAATIYDRWVAAMAISTENEDDFIKNMVTIRFEERLALAVKRPLAFVHGHLSGESS